MASFAANLEAKYEGEYAKIMADQPAKAESQLISQVHCVTDTYHSQRFDDNIF